MDRGASSDVDGGTRIGGLIRELRTVHRWSQSRLADLLCRHAECATLTREDISRWEAGRRCPSPFWLRHLAAVLDVPLGLMETADVNRRSFLSSVAAATIAPLVSSDLIHHGFAAALAEHTAPGLDQWEARTERYGRDYLALGAADIQRRLAGDLVLLQQHLETPGAWVVAAKLMTLYGKTIPGADGSKAIQWYRMAADAADRSGDDDVRVWVRGRAAIALGYEGASLPIAQQFADEALAISDRPSLGRLNATMGGAHTAVLRGDRARARALLIDGQRLHDRIGSHEQTSDYAVPAWRMGVFASLLAARLGDERGALAAQDAAATTLPDTLPRFRTHLELHRGLMLARSGDEAGGLAYAQAAMDQLPPEKHSLTLRLLVAEIRAAA
ncbi:MAG: helix-turn-helix domain-containing protein [Pseudonocardia sp.]